MKRGKSTSPRKVTLLAANSRRFAHETTPKGTFHGRSHRERRHARRATHR